MKVYFKPDGEMLEFEVPDGAVDVCVGGECFRRGCGSHIDWIDFKNMVYGCKCGHESDIPALAYRMCETDAGWRPMTCSSGCTEVLPGSTAPVPSAVMSD